VSAVRVCVLQGLGINADEELIEVFAEAGAEPAGVHVTDLAEGVARLQDYHILALPGGFSFGDHLGSGRVLAMLLRRRLGESLRAFVREGRLAIGICNGFQVLAKAGLLPDLAGSGTPEVSLVTNDSGKFEDRWVRVGYPSSACVWTAGLAPTELPVRHGEGRLIAADDGVLRALLSGGRVAAVYLPRSGAGPAAYPDNPNGSIADIAGLCDASGRVFGLMPHPEAFRFPENHPRWTREPVAEAGGLAVFRQGVAFARRAPAGRS
jgi:phosphoribosylformylglycinamidine synthase subunit PurQ / glutaminase